MPTSRIPFATQRAAAALLPHSTLDRTLTTLEWIAGVLAAVLVVVGVLAFAAYKRNRKAALTPHD